MALKYEVLMGNLEYIIAVVDQRGRILELNRWIKKTPPMKKLVGNYFVDLIKTDAEQVRFHNTLRKVFDTKKATRADFHLSGSDDKAIHLEVNFQPSLSLIGKKPVAEDFAILIIRDISKTIIERQNTERLIDRYKKTIESANKQAGLMDLEGNIIDFNYTLMPENTAEDFIQRSVYDFITESGAKKIKNAFANIKKGSHFERVHYKPEDLKIASRPEGIIVNYEPIIANGEVVFVKLNEIQD